MKVANKVTQVLVVRDDFSPTPGARKPHEGEFSGEDFRLKVLLPAVLSAIENRQVLIVDMDGTAGFGTSFLEEAFGGLIRINGINYHSLIEILKIKSDEEGLLSDDIYRYIEDAYNVLSG